MARRNVSLEDAGNYKTRKNGEALENFETLDTRNDWNDDFSENDWDDDDSRNDWDDDSEEDSGYRRCTERTSARSREASSGTLRTSARSRETSKGTRRTSARSRETSKGTQRASSEGGNSKKRKRGRKRIRWDNVMKWIILILSVTILILLISRAAGGCSSPELLAPPETTAALTQYDGFIVCLDAGHGGDDAGCVYEGVHEKDETLSLTMKVQDILERHGIQVVMTRTTDTTLQLTDRTNTANASSADCLVSIHRNYVESHAASGVEAWINSASPQDAASLAGSLLDAISQTGLMDNRGVKSGTQSGNDNYAINSHSKMASCILEVGFMSSDADNKALRNHEDEMAQAIADGIIAYLTGAESTE